MSSTLQAFTQDGHVVITLPDRAIPAQQREDFIAFVKAEWTARQSQFTAHDAEELADEIDTKWWSENRERILRLIGES